MRSQNVICGVNFDRFWIFDRHRPSWILRKMKNSSAGLFLGSSCMSIPNLTLFILFIWLGQNQNLAWTYYLTLETSLRMNFSQNPRWLPGVKIEFLQQFCSKITFKLDKWILFIWLAIWTKFGRNILLDHRNKHVEEFLIHRNIQDGWCGRHYGRLWNQSKLEKM